VFDFFKQMGIVGRYFLTFLKIMNFYPRIAMLVCFLWISPVCAVKEQTGDQERPHKKRGIKNDEKKAFDFAKELKDYIKKIKFQRKVEMNVECRKNKIGGILMAALKKTHGQHGCVPIAKRNELSQAERRILKEIMLIDMQQEIMPINDSIRPNQVPTRQTSIQQNNIWTIPGLNSQVLRPLPLAPGLKHLYRDNDSTAESS